MLGCVTVRLRSGSEKEMTVGATTGGMAEAATVSGTGPGGNAAGAVGVTGGSGHSFNLGGTARYEGMWAIFGNWNARASAGRCVSEASAGSSAFSQVRKVCASPDVGAITLTCAGGGRSEITGG